VDTIVQLKRGFPSKTYAEKEKGQSVDKKCKKRKETRSMVKRYRELVDMTGERENGP